MKPIKDKTLDALEDVAMEGAKQLRAFFTYEGDNPKFFQKARIAAAAISGYSRLRASETNRMAVELASTRILTGGDLPKMVGDGN